MVRKFLGIFTAMVMSLFAAVAFITAPVATLTTAAVTPLVAVTTVAVAPIAVVATVATVEVAATPAHAGQYYQNPADAYPAWNDENPYKGGTCNRSAFGLPIADDCPNAVDGGGYRPEYGMPWGQWKAIHGGGSYGYSYGGGYAYGYQPPVCPPGSIPAPGGCFVPHPIQRWETVPCIVGPQDPACQP